jgi:hypothetical protein
MVLVEGSQRQTLNVAIFYVFFFGCICRRRIWTKKVAVKVDSFGSGVGAFSLGVGLKKTSNFCCFA